MMLLIFIFLNYIIIPVNATVRKAYRLSKHIRAINPVCLSKRTDFSTRE